MGNAPRSVRKTPKAPTVKHDATTSPYQMMMKAPGGDGVVGQVLRFSCEDTKNNTWREPKKNIQKELQRTAIMPRRTIHDGQGSHTFGEVHERNTYILPHRLRDDQTPNHPTIALQPRPKPHFTSLLRSRLITYKVKPLTSVQSPLQSNSG
ncbi:hypothetical protein BDZ94DRAFT_266986 [Collybia nuda]|uniref:Uncharacterized protein n=1 Tax=Collybia nuda TaxID=64659 RepID=A0A9P5XX04_9AGAR|nr:hypothetical protein BDZ94DRAFT_266986 [Collybia nuda]